MPGGRPTKFNQKMRDKIMALAGAGKTDKQIAQEIHVSESTIHHWKHLHGAEFSESLKEAKCIADELVEASLLNRALGYQTKEIKFFAHEGTVTDQKEVIKEYPPDPTSMIFWLKNRQPDRWRDKQEIEQTNRNIEIKIDSDDRDL